VDPDEVQRAQQALNRTREDLMSRTGVHAVFVGLLPDRHGIPGQQIGIRVVVDPVTVETDLQRLPRSIEGFPVRVERGAPAPEE
jgi:hypothetical protein